MFDVVIGILDRAEDTSSYTPEFYTSCVRTLSTLVAYGNLDISFISNSVGHLCRFLRYGAFLEDPLVDFLCHALERVPSLAERFIQASFKFDTRLHLRAIVAYALANIPRMEKNFGLAKMVAFMLAQYMTNPDLTSRKGIYEVLNILSSDKVCDLKDGAKFATHALVPLQLMSTVSSIIDSSRTRDGKFYSDALAKAHCGITPQFLQCLARWFSFFQDNHKLVFLQLLPAWSANFMSIFQESKTCEGSRKSNFDA